MTTSFDNCDICNLRHISKHSVIWCSDCDEGLCLECSEHHSLSKLSRNHSVVPIAEYKKLPSFLVNIKLHCDKHDEKYSLFCKEHNECVCRKCIISEKHKKCKEMIPVEDVIQNSKTSVVFTEIESSLQEMKGNITLILEDRQKNLSSLSDTKKKIESEILAVRQQINHHLDKIQDQFINELTSAVENSTQEIQSFLASVQEIQREIDECIEDIVTIKKHATDLQTFLGIKELENKLNATENTLLSWSNCKRLAHTVVSYQLNTVLQNINDEINTFGKTFVDSQACELSLHRRKEGQAQLIKGNIGPGSCGCSIENITLKLKTNINTSASNVSGCCILPCGKFVVANYDPSYLILFSPDGKIEKTIADIMPTIYDVACIDNDVVAVVSVTEKNIQLVNLKSEKTIKTIQTSSPCCGITHSEGNLIVCPKKGQLQQIRLEDNKTSEIGSDVVSLYIAAFGNTLYSRKRDVETIICHNRNGDILWTFTNKTALKGPRGIAVDEYGNIFVAGTKSKTITAIASDGSKHKILLSEKDLVGSPWSICYNNKLKVLLVANQKDSQAYLYIVNHVNHA
ncbi:E3 ubiquitin-protein ligase TRIM71-like [Mytilus edulis]|uniref:E3 ubiquitin-protein ligase TRIM71-like n=1 Tax=Mytilus edulis TaxID=6550 RepID=UPI0039EF9BFF